MKLWFSAAFAAVALCCAGPARATQGEREASGTLAWGPAALGVDGQLLMHASDFWAFGGAVRARLIDPRRPLAGAAVTVRYTIDALTWIPSVACGAGAEFDFLRGQLSPAVHAQAELIMRAARQWGLVARVVAEANPANINDFRGLIALGYVRFWGKGDGPEL